MRPATGTTRHPAPVAPLGRHGLGRAKSELERVFLVGAVPADRRSRRLLRAGVIFAAHVRRFAGFGASRLQGWRWLRQVRRTRGPPAAARKRRIAESVSNYAVLGSFSPRSSAPPSLSATYRPDERPSRCVIPISRSGLSPNFAIVVSLSERYISSRAIRMLRPRAREVVVAFDLETDRRGGVEVTIGGDDRRELHLGRHLRGLFSR